MNAQAWAQDALENLGYPNLSVAIEWKKSFTSRLGDAIYVHPGPRIRLSIPLWPRASETARRETVMHEICHVIVGLEAKRDNKHASHHGKEWKHKMRCLGIEPKRCHDVNRDGLKRTRKTVTMYCACKIQMETPRVARRIQAKTHSYTCRKCRKEIRFEPYACASVEQPKPKPKTKTFSSRISEWIRKAAK